MSFLSAEPNAEISEPRRRGDPPPKVEAVSRPLQNKDEPRRTASRLDRPDVIRHERKLDRRERGEHRPDLLRRHRPEDAALVIDLKGVRRDRQLAVSP